jgi:hypothetical protein
MGFADIDGDEFHLLMVFAVQIRETPGPSYIGRSGKAAED